MYKYNLIIKRGDLDYFAARAMVNRELVKRFGPDVHYIITASLDNEVVVILSDESKRGLQSALGNWFIEPQRALWKERKSSYPSARCFTTVRSFPLSPSPISLEA